MPKRTVLSNGVRVVTESIPWAQSVSIGFWIERGTRDEGPGEAGYAHFVEHMLFKGTKTRTARDIAEAMDRTGGHLNAFTTKETTCFHCRILPRHMPLAMELMADMLLNSTFSPPELARERTVILEEISQVEDTPEDLVHEMFDERVFGAHPLAGPVLGTAASVKAADRERLLRFVRRNYRPAHLVVALAGNVEHDEAVAEAERLLGRWAAAPAGTDRTPVPLRYSPTRTVLDKDGEQVHLCVGVPGLPRTDPDRYALDVLDTLLGGGMSSRLFQQLREEKGLVYSTYSFSADYFDAGVLGCYAAAGPERADEVLDLIVHELAAVGAGGVAAVEVERAKEQLKGNVLLGWEHTGTRMGALAAAELADEPYLDAETLSAHYDRVTLDDVRRVAARLLAPETFSVVVLGPVGKAGKTPNILEAIG